MQGGTQGIFAATSGEIINRHFSHLKTVAKEHQCPLTLSGSGSANDWIIFENRRDCILSFLSLIDSISVFVYIAANLNKNTPPN